MRSSNSSTTPQLVSSDLVPAGARPTERSTAELSVALASPLSGEKKISAPEPGIVSRLAYELEAANDLKKVESLLVQVDCLPPKAIKLESVFSALKKLAASESELQRFAAYRRLAELHRIDLRYENRARLIMREGLKLESGLAARRLRRLLKNC
ncbi:MAG: hypothetical protein ACU84Q_20805 [Gammaproteobacteria bacterium]